jgi:hypothetical protein
MRTSSTAATTVALVFDGTAFGPPAEATEPSAGAAGVLKDCSTPSDAGPLEEQATNAKSRKEVTLS